MAALTQDGQKYSDYMSSLQDEFQNNGIEFVMNRKFPKEATDMSMVSFPKFTVTAAEEVTVSCVRPFMHSISFF